jgi:hypothetical protein
MTPSGILALPGTNECAAMSDPLPICAPSMTIAPLPMMVPAPTTAPCTTQPCPMVARGPSSAVSPGGPCMTEPSCTFAPALM